MATPQAWFQRDVRMAITSFPGVSKKFKCEVSNPKRKSVVCQTTQLTDVVVADHGEKQTEVKKSG